MEITLPDRFWDKVAGFPEHSYGVQLVSLVLKEGTRVSHVYLAWGREILAEKSKLPANFSVSEIADVENEG